MTTTPANPFDAADSFVGYLYQCRLALVWSLERITAGDADFAVSIELIDDVAFDQGTTPREALQTKHSLHSKADLTDASVDLWKTLRTWVEGRGSGRLPPECALYLITTATAGAGSAAERLRRDGRDVALAADLLTTTASSSQNKANTDAYAAFLSLDLTQRRDLLDRVVLDDAAPNIVALDERLRRLVHAATEPEFLASLLTRLEGWWLHRVLVQITTTNPAERRITGDEIEAELATLRSQLRRESLPIDEDVRMLDVDDHVIAAHDARCFVQQLRLIDVKAKRIALAIRDYLRAYTQRSKWTRESLVYVGELEKYERRLVEEWEIHFERMREKLGDAAVATERVRLARELYDVVEGELTIPIRDVTEGFIVRGSYQMLADGRRVGWHADFLERLDAVLGVSVVQ